jgi:HlyD family secretion protein
MKKNKYLRLLLIAALVLIVFAIIGKKAGWFGKELTYNVSAEKPIKRDITEIVTANGKIQPETEVIITPDVSGEIVELNIVEGQFVEKGTPLLKIKPDVYISAKERTEAALNSSKANLMNANARLSQMLSQLEQNRLAYERSKKLFEQNTIAEADWITVKTTYDVSKSQVDAAKEDVKAAEFAVKSAEATLKESNENLIKTSIVAPMTGTISVLKVEKGERVAGTNMMAGTEMLRIADLNRMEVKVDVNENDIVRVNVNDTALVEVDAYLGQKFKGVVTEISNSANTSGLAADQVTNFTVKILLLQSSYQALVDKGNKNPFRPGMSASVEIQTQTRHNVLSIPIQSVTTRIDSTLLKKTKKTDNTKTSAEASNTNDAPQEMVFVVDSNKAKLKPIRTGIQDSYFIEVVDGLTEKSQVVTGPYSAISRKLSDGTPVIIVPKEKLFEGENK